MNIAATKKPLISCAIRRCFSEGLKQGRPAQIARCHQANACRNQDPRALLRLEPCDERGGCPG
jgi:hypothetical protein